MVIVLTGAPASGKSTVAESLASRLEHAAHIQVDFLRKMVKGGYASPHHWSDEGRPAVSHRAHERGADRAQSRRGWIHPHPGRHCPRRVGRRVAEGAGRARLPVRRAAPAARQRVCCG